MHYFAYSSNMSFEHMRRMCGRHFTVLGAAILEGFEFGPDHRGYANIREKQGSKVFGVLYEVDQEGLDILDDFDGYPTVFNRMEVTVKNQDGESFKTWVYIQPAEQFGGKYIKVDFLKRVIAGARENRLPENWLEFLESFSEGDNSRQSEHHAH
jgi:gamma-glutamylcyclotransferase